MHAGEMVNHPGFDLAATTGTPVAAAAGGTVVHAGPAGTYGNLVTLRHDNGFETRYAHLSSIDVKVGDRVEAGSGLGKVGSTGYSTGPHLHFEVRHGGKAIDPAPLLPLNSSLVRTTR
jgi:murein DD-endopeptidase MepM/ murein hydrolase activator NlpD